MAEKTSAMLQRPLDNLFALANSAEKTLLTFYKIAVTNTAGVQPVLLLEEEAGGGRPSRPLP